jgi:hypothetical protein
MSSITGSIRITKGADGGVLLDVEQGAIFTLNTVAVRIIELLQQGYPSSSIVSQISREFGATEQAVRGDVADFLQLLGKQGLLAEQRHTDHDSEI